MGLHLHNGVAAMPLIRPRLVIEAARAGAAVYRRSRDLAAALAGAWRDTGNLSRDAIVTHLAEAEEGCERLRRSRSPAYQPARHVQVLAALLAEAAGNQAKASGSEALRSAM